MAIFPDDENGDVLRRMEAAGDDLTQPRQVDFAHLFSDEAQARAFATSISASELVVSVTPFGEKQAWDVTVSKVITPRHADIGALEGRLAEEAASFGGDADGWGCTSVPRLH